MSIVDQIPAVLLWLIRAGTAFRVTYCLVRLIGADDEAPMYKKRIRNLLIFYAIAETALALKDIIISVFS